MSGSAMLSELTRTQREAFVAMLAELDDEQWQEPSLCAEWRVVDVAAHLAWAPVLGAGAGALALARYGFSMNRMIARSAVACRPEEWEVHMVLGEVLAAAGQKPAAVDALEQAVKLAPSSEPRPKQVLARVKAER